MKNEKIFSINKIRKYLKKKDFIINKKKNVWLLLKSQQTWDPNWGPKEGIDRQPAPYTHLRAHETRHDLVCRLLLEKKKKHTFQQTTQSIINPRSDTMSYNLYAI